MHLVTPKRSRWCVVVADDDSDWRTLMARTLRRSGYIVTEVGDGDELVGRCRSLDASGEQHVVVVSDVEMPGCSGIEATASLRSMHIDAPVLLVTGTQSTTILDAARRAGAVAVLRKPVSGDRIVAMVNGIATAVERALPLTHY